MASLTIKDLHLSLGGNAILKGIDLAAAHGEFVVLVGPSGCGKSTLLRAISGLTLPDGGQVLIGDQDVTQAAPRQRDLAMVFQSYALYPHLTVRENLAFGLRLRKTPSATIDERVREVSTLLGIDALLERLPKQLSGGQRQRVAMGRAIARRPQLFLFDEPLSNLDAALRNEVRVEIKKLHARLDATMVYVTHDQVEAMTLADRLVVLNAGEIEQVGPPLEVYARPATRFVASFLGSPSMNLLTAEAGDDTIEATGLRLPLPFPVTPGTVSCGIRPQDVLLGAPGASPIQMEVEVVEAMGFETYVHGHVGGQPFVARLNEEEGELPTPGDTLGMDIREGAVHLFDDTTGVSLRP